MKITRIRLIQGTNVIAVYTDFVEGIAFNFDLDDVQNDQDLKLKVNARIIQHRAEEMTKSAKQIKVDALKILEGKEI